jgi:hypothetical protein
MALWSPYPTPTGILGELEVEWSRISFQGDTPMVVLANPIIYRTSGDDLPEALKSSKPFDLNEIDLEVQPKLAAGCKATITHWGAKHENPALTAFGFGPHGFEARVVGQTMERYTAQVQKLVKAEITNLIEN